MLGIPQNTGNLSRHLGAGGVYLFGIGAFLAPAAANVAFALLILGLALDGRRGWRVLRGDPTLWLLTAFVLYLVGSLLWAWPPEGREADLDGARRLLKLWLFLPLAYWLGGDTARIERFLLCVLVGFMLGRLVDVDWFSIPTVATGDRLRLGFSSVNHFGCYAATVFLGLLAYTGRFWQVTDGYDPRLAWSLRGAWILTATIVLYWMLASQSRGAIGALLLTLVLCVFLVGYLHGQHATLLLLGLIAVGTLVVGLVASGPIAERVAVESGTLPMILRGDWSGIPFDNTGIRLHMLRYGRIWWLERPWVGHGIGASEGMLASVLEFHGEKHLHNTLIDNLVRLGVVGTLLLQCLFISVFVALLRGTRGGLVPLALGVFGLGALVLSFVFGQTDYRMGAWDWRHYWVVIGAIAYALPLAERAERVQKT
jgi:O-antigen ligase